MNFDKNVTPEDFINSTSVPADDQFNDDNEWYKRTHMAYALDRAKEPGLIIEFGVYIGRSITQIANYFDADVVYGFDSFEGLPVPWQRTDTMKIPKGHFALKELPEVPPNVDLVVGWFNETLPEFLDKHPGNIKYMHIDCDVYESGKDIFNLCNDRIVPGTVITFDDFIPFVRKTHKYTKWDEGLWKAFKEWLAENDREFEIIARSPYTPASVKITS